MKFSIVRTIAEGTFFTSSGTLMVKVIGLATVFVILRNFGAAEYGTLELALSLTALFSIFLLPGLDSVVLADAGAYKGRGALTAARRLLSAYFLLQCMLAGVAFAITFLGAPLFADAYNLPEVYVRAVSLLFLISPFQTLYGVLLRLHLRFFQSALLTFVQETVKLGVLLVCVYVFGFGVLSIIGALVLSQATGLLVFTPLCLHLWRGLWGGEEDGAVNWRTFLWGHSAWGVLSSYLGSFGKAIRLWIIQFLLGPEAVGLYAVASGLMGHTTALAPLSSVLTPMLPQYAHDKSRFSRLLTKGVQYQLLANIGVGIAVFFVAPPVIGWLFPQYAAAMPLFEIMLLALVPGAVVSVITPAFSALKLQRSLFASMLLKTVLTAVGTYFGIALFGIWGIAYEPVLTAWVQALERMRSLQKRAPGFAFSRATFTSVEDDRLMWKAVLGKVEGVLGVRGWLRGK